MRVERLSSGEYCKSSLILEAERTPFFGHNNIIFIGKNAEIKKIMTELYSDMYINEDIYMYQLGHNLDYFPT